MVLASYDVHVSNSWSAPVAFHAVEWDQVPDLPGVYAVFDSDRFLYVGMAGRNGRGSLRRRLKDHRNGNMVNMLKQYLWFAIVQHQSPTKAGSPAEAAARCRAYMDRCLSFRYRSCEDGAVARALEAQIKQGDSPWGAPELNTGL